jgi:hypothetical protein
LWVKVRLRGSGVTLQDFISFLSCSSYFSFQNMAQ